MTHRLRLLPLFLVLPFAARADVDQQGWFQFTVNHRDPSGWRFFGELQPRIGEEFSDPTQFLARFAVGKQLNKTFSMWGGYAFTPNIRPRWTAEDRYFLQPLWENRSGSWNLVNRTRLEFRQIARTFGTSVRLRHLVRGTTPFKTASPNYFVAQMEPFYNLNSLQFGPRAGFEQLRVFGGVGRRFTKTFRAEIGYQPVYFSLPRTRRFDTLFLSANLDF